MTSFSVCVNRVNLGSILHSSCNVISFLGRRMRWYPLVTNSRRPWHSTGSKEMSISTASLVMYMCLSTAYQLMYIHTLVQLFSL